MTYLCSMVSKSKTANQLKEQSLSNQPNRDIFDRIKAGEPIRLDDPQYEKVQAIVSRTLQLSAQLNTSTDVNQIRNRLSQIIGREIDQSKNGSCPLFTKFGRFIQIGNNVFVETMPVPSWTWVALPSKMRF